MCTIWVDIGRLWTPKLHLWLTKSQIISHNSYTIVISYIIFLFLSFLLQILGKTGVVLGQNSKGDIAIRFEGKETDLLLNPRCIEPVTDEPVALKPGEQRYELACTLSGQLYIESSPRPLFPTSEEGGRQLYSN